MKSIIALLLLAVAANAQNLTWPKYPEQFKFTTSGPIPGYTCIQIQEPSDPVWARQTNYFCHEAGENIRNIGMRWSFTGRISTMKCRPVYEPSEPAKYKWLDNFICVPIDAPYEFQFFNYVPRMNYRCRCLQWYNAKDPDTWGDNFLCDWRVSC
uniref:Uncharacterized protein n=1 Tax=Clytia hemisphaerica TaxID=252671 RepID=A0A7M5WU82_9CNID